VATARKNTLGERILSAGVLAGLCAALALTLAAPAAAATPAGELTPAQQRMKTCNTRAKERGLERAERRHFMTDCLNGHDGEGHALTPHQEKHEECNAQARGLEGAERRGYMTECEKSDVAKRTAPREKAKNCARRADGRGLQGDERAAYVRGCLNGDDGAAR
jgi:psiF repeat-containing protein